MRLRSISERSEASQAPPNIRSNNTAAARMTTRKAAISFRKIPFLTSFFSLWGLEAVTRAAHGLKIARVFGIGLNFFADAADVNIDRARSDVRGVAPNGIEKMIAGKDATKMAGEIIEQAKLGGSGRDGLSANGENHGGGIDFDVADLERTRRQRTLKAAEHGLHAGDEFARAEGLGDVVVGSEFEAKDAIGFAAFGGKENYGYSSQTLGLTDGAAEFETVLARDHDIEHEQRRPLALGVNDYCGAVGIDANGKTFVLQMMANEARNIRIVFDDEDAWFHGFIVMKGFAST